MRRVAWLMVVVLLLGGCAAANAAEPSPKAAEAEKKYGYLGVESGAVPDALAVQFGLKKGEGILVTGVEKDSPAEKAGIKKGDVITKLGDQIVLAEEQFRNLVGYAAPGTKLKVTFIREAKSQTVDVTLGGTDKLPRAGRLTLRVMAPHVEILPRPDGTPCGTTILRIGPDSKTFQFPGDMKDMPVKVKELLEKEGIPLPPGFEQHLKSTMSPPPDDKMKETVSFDFVKTPLTDVVTFLGQIKKLNIVLDPALRAANPPVTLKLENVPLGTALKFICADVEPKLASDGEKVKVEFVFQDNNLIIGSPDFINKCTQQPPPGGKVILRIGPDGELHRVPGDMKDIPPKIKELLEKRGIPLPDNLAGPGVATSAGLSTKLTVQTIDGKTTGTLTITGPDGKETVIPFEGKNVPRVSTEVKSVNGKTTGTITIVVDGKETVIPFEGEQLPPEAIDKLKGALK